MGLDQYFYKRNPKMFQNQEEVFYQRKNWALHDLIQSVIDEKIENGEAVRLDKDRLISIAEKIVEVLRDEDFTDDSLEDNYHFNQYLQFIGICYVYPVIYYCPDW